MTQTSAVHGKVKLDAAALERALRSRVSGEVRFDRGTRAVYAQDASNYRQIPIGVVLPRTVEDIVAAVAACREFGAPLLARGGGTSQCGQCVNVAVVLDASSHLNRVLEIDPAARSARVEPGVVCDTLRDAADRRAAIYRGLVDIRDRYADPIRARFPKLKRRVSGYNLEQLLPENGFNVARALVGSEGTCAVTLQAKTRLVASPKERVIAVLGFPDIYLAADAAPGVMEFGPIALEGLDERIIGGIRARGLRLEDLAQLPAGRGWLMVEFGGHTLGEARERALALVASYDGKPDAPICSFTASRETKCNVVARYIQQLPESRNGNCGRRNARGGRVFRDGAAAESVLRAAALRLRHAGSGAAGAAPDYGRARYGDQSWHAHCSAGAGVRVGLQGRVAQFFPG